MQGMTSTVATLTTTHEEQDILGSLQATSETSIAGSTCCQADLGRSDLATQKVVTDTTATGMQRALRVAACKLAS